MSKEIYKRVSKNKKRRRKKLYRLVLYKDHNLVDLSTLSYRIDQLGLKIKEKNGNYKVVEKNTETDSVNSEVLLKDNYPVSRALDLVTKRIHPRNVMSYKREAREVYIDQIKEINDNK